MNLLQLIQQLCQELGLGVPTSVMSSVDPQITQMRALLGRHGHDLARQYDWQRLNREYLVQTVAFSRTGTTVAGSRQVTVSTTGVTTNFTVTGQGVQPFAAVSSVDSANVLTLNAPALRSGTVTLNLAQTAYPLPSDWLKQVPQTEWDRTNHWPMLGPDSPQQWQSYRSGIVYPGPRERFRILGNAVQITPPPPNGLVFSYEYISSAWIIGSAGLTTQFAADTDTWVFDDSLMIAGLKVRWKQAKGLDFQFETAEYANLLSMLKAQDRSAPVLDLSSRRDGTFLMDGCAGATISAVIGVPPQS